MPDQTLRDIRAFREKMRGHNRLTRENASLILAAIIGIARGQVALIIREQQMAILRKTAFAAFESEMVAHSKEFSPRLCKVIGDEQLRVALRQAMDRADGYGFSFRGPIRLYIELMFLYGSSFDTDPQYPWASTILSASDDQMVRAEQLFDKTVEYQEKVSGPNAVNTRKALKDLLALAGQPLTVRASDLDTDLIRVMDRVFPQKAAYIGQEGLTKLVHEGRSHAMQHRLPTPRGDVLIVALMFAFGHGCTNDPLYPWIARTLNDEKILEPTARAERLERKSVTWLEHVLANVEREEQA